MESFKCEAWLKCLDGLVQYSTNLLQDYHNVRCPRQRVKCHSLVMVILRYDTYFT
jgi:hypothetical protein